MHVSNGRAQTRGRDVNATDESGRTPLFHAIIFSHLDAVVALLRAGAAVAVADKVGETPLCAAAATGVVDIIGALLSAGAGVDAPDARAWTPLFHAAAKGRGAAVRALLAAGAAPLARDADGCASPLRPRACSRAPSAVLRAHRVRVASSACGRAV